MEDAVSTTDAGNGEEAAGGAQQGRSLRERKQTLRAIERDIIADQAVDAELSDEKRGKRGWRRHGIAQNAATGSGKSRVPVPTTTNVADEAMIKLDADFTPITDLKGADPACIVGRRIRVWYQA